MLTKVQFQNLRCFKNFMLDGMTPLTLISGRNNIGKTTLLEGIFLIYAHRSPELFFKINSIRGIPPAIASPQGFIVGMEPLSLWETLFSDMDMSQKLQIYIEDNNGINSSICLEKSPVTSIAVTKFQNQQNKINQQNILQPVSGSYMLNLSYTSGKITEKGRFILTQNGLAINFDAKKHIVAQTKFAQYIGPNIPLSQNHAPDWLGKIELEGQKSKIVESLSILDENIMDIFSVPRHGIVELYARRRSAKPRPVCTLGDGINKLFVYLLAMIANPGGIFLLDEIETGFHYSFYSRLWEIIASVAKKTGSQVIATTHSRECIAAAVEGTEKIDSSLLTYVRLAKENDAIVPYVFTKDDLAFALKSEMEVR